MERGEGPQQHEAPGGGFLIGRLGSFPTWVCGPVAAGELQEQASTRQAAQGQGGGGGWVQPLKCRLPLVWSLFHITLEIDAQVVSFSVWRS